MSVLSERISLSIQRSVKVGEYQYNKIELEMTVEILNEGPKEVIKRLYTYIGNQVDELLKAELTKVDSNKRAVAKMMEKDDEPPFCFETE